MNTKSFNISSSGLKNLILESAQEDEFNFIFNENAISMKTVFAEFISPEVSKIHRSDSTISTICFNNQLGGIKINQELLSKIKLLAMGESISICEEESFQMKIISILLGNEELFNKITELYSSDANENNIDQYLNNLTTLNKFSPFFDRFDIDNIINFISSHFYLIDQKKMTHLPKHILLSIISNDKLKLDSEDSLFEFITQIFKEDETSENEEDYNINITSFYECLEISGLSDEKFKEFIESIHPSEISNELWRRLCTSFYSIKNNCTSNDGRYTSNNNRYNQSMTQFLNDKGPFEGIIDFLTKKSGGNVSENGTVKLTASSIYRDNYVKNAVDLHNHQNHFQTDNHKNSWLKFDFGEMKIKLTSYSIRSRDDSNIHHMKNWVIEGSNKDSNDWKTLDSRQDDSYLKSINAVHTYNIEDKQVQDESFRYIRIRINDLNSSGCFYLTFSAIEFFGSLID